MTVRGCVSPGLLVIAARAGLRGQDASAKIRIEKDPNGEPFGQRDIPIFQPQIKMDPSLRRDDGEGMCAVLVWLGIPARSSLCGDDGEAGICPPVWVWPTKRERTVDLGCGGRCRGRRFIVDDTSSGLG